MMERISPSYFRILREDGGGGGRGPGGPIVVLVVVCILFCIIWAPMLCQRRFRRRSRQQAEEQAAEIIRGSLRNLNLLRGRLEGNGESRNANITDHIGGGLSREERRAFIKNVLVSRRIVQITTTETLSDDDLDVDNDDGDGDNGFDKETKVQYDSTSRKSTMILADVMDAETTTKHVSVELCAICLNDYQRDDILCWSQSTRCKHFFHRDCMEEWLLRHHECPCCRNNYLSLGDGEDDDVGQASLPMSHQEADVDDTSAFLRGIHLFQLLSRLQNLAENPGPNTTIRVDGHGGNLEIQGGASPERNSSTANEQRGLQMQEAGRGMSMRFRTGLGSIADRSQQVAREPTVASGAPEDNSPSVDTTSPDHADIEESGENNLPHV